MIEPGQVWLDRDRKYRPARFIRIDRMERRDGVNVVKISSRRGTAGEWLPVLRFIRADRLVKCFTLQEG